MAGGGGAGGEGKGDGGQISRNSEGILLGEVFGWPSSFLLSPPGFLINPIFWGVFLPAWAGRSIDFGEPISATTLLRNFGWPSPFHLSPPGFLITTGD